MNTFQWAFSAPLKNIPIRLTQPDGQVIECFASGDEFYNYLHDANGFTIVKGEDGYYCYAMHDSRGEVVASSYRVNTVDPASVGLQPYAKISEKAYWQRRQAREQHIQPIKRPADGELNHGRYNNLVVFIRFAGDTYHSTPYSAVDSMFNANHYESVSLHNYFHHASYNQLDLHSYLYPHPDGETILSYEDIYPKEYYMPYDSVTNPIGYQDGETAEREFSMLERAIYYVADQVSDTLDLDYNRDGNIDNVVFVIKGRPGEWSSLLWPHRWCIYDREVWLKGLRVYDFNLQLEIGDYFNISSRGDRMSFTYGPVNHETIPQNLISHVDAIHHEVVLRWDQVIDAESYIVYRDGEHPQAGVLATYTAADNGLGLIAPQHVNASSNGPSILLDWTIPTENTEFDIYRGGRKVKAAFEGYNYLDDKSRVRELTVTMWRPPSTVFRHGIQNKAYAPTP